MDETRLRPTESVETALPSLADLPGLSRAELAGLWRQMFGRPVPKSISLALLLRFLAFEIQVRAHGGLPAGFGEALARRVGEAAGGKTVTARLRPGGRLLREWNGTTHVVDIVEGGFVWRGGPPMPRCPPLRRRSPAPIGGVRVSSG